MSNGPRWAPIASTPRELEETLRALWSSASRVDGAIRDGRWLTRALVPPAEGTPPTRVRLVTADGSPSGLLGPGADIVVGQSTTPEFLLFYLEASAFPHSALLFSGGDEHDWATVQRRPLVLYRLQARFLALWARSRPVAAVGAVREGRPRPPQPGAAVADVPVEHVAPQTLYRRVLAVHFQGMESADTGRPAAAPSLAAHQARAYERAQAILNRYGGVIVADAVGLGKTYIGLRLLERALLQGGRVLVIAPAALREQWGRELEYLKDAAGGRRVPVVTVESLSRRDFEADACRGADLVLVDEAHNFRNPGTQRYRRLAEILRHPAAALLTATPINNTVLDLQHLIDLFAAPGAFRHLGVPDYRQAFQRGTLAKRAIDTIISACVVRRTRRFLRSAYGEVRVVQRAGQGEAILRFPRRLPPVAVRYDLVGTYGALFTGLEDWLAALGFPSIDLEEEEGEVDAEIRHSGDLLKIILLKRLESSLEAFRATVVQQLAWCNTALSAIEAGRLLSRPDYRASFQGPPDDPGSQLAFFELMLPKPSVDPARLNELRAGLQHDLQILARLHAALIAIGPAGDRKLEALLELLDGPLAGRKVLLFTEFRDTARYIHHRLRGRPYIGQIDSGGARLGLDRASRRDVIARFAPVSNGLREPPRRERVDLLIATDVLSEGLNLQDATVVVSYDLPWNPVRLMQRMGRIDRLSTAAQTVQLYHFVPAQDIERLLGLMGRLRAKVRTISDLLGLDGPVLATPTAPDRTLDQLQTLIRGADGYDRVEAELEGGLDPEEQAYIDFIQLSSGAATDSAATGEPGPHRPPLAACRLAGDRSSTAGAVAYWRLQAPVDRRALWLVYDRASGRVVEDQAAAFQRLRAIGRDDPGTPPPALLQEARSAFARHAHGVLARLEAARIAGDDLHPGLPQCRIAAWMTRRLEAEMHRLETDERRRMDALLERLAQRFALAVERGLAELAGSLPDHLDPAILAAVERSLPPAAAARANAYHAEEVGTLLVVPSQRCEKVGA